MSAYGDVTRTLTRSGITYADLGLANEAALTSLAADLIEQASETVDLYCGRDFALHEDVAERLDGTGRRRLRLRGHPIVAVASVAVGGVSLTKDLEYEVDAGPGILERVDGAVWPPGRRNVTVVYTYGYATPPGAIAGVVEDLVAGALTHAARNRAVKGASSMSMDGFSVSFATMAAAMNLGPDMQKVLDRYRVTGGA